MIVTRIDFLDGFYLNVVGYKVVRPNEAIFQVAKVLSERSGI